MNTSSRYRHNLLAASIGIVATLALGACSPSAPTPPAAPSASAQADANEAAADKELKMYQQMLADHKAAFAVPIGQEIAQKYPGTAAATEVGKTLPGLEATLQAQAEHDRLVNLWYYQTADVQGLQHTASIYATGHDRADQIRLVLRRHVKWGQSVYLFGNGKGFVCKGNCRVPMTFDGKRENWTGYLPPTGEPAMFIKDDKRFIAALAKAKVITMDVETKDHGKQTLKFEVGGYNPAQFQPLPKK